MKSPFGNFGGDESPLGLSEKSEIEKSILCPWTHRTHPAIESRAKTRTDPARLPHDCRTLPAQDPHEGRFAPCDPGWKKT